MTVTSTHPSRVVVNTPGRESEGSWFETCSDELLAFNTLVDLWLGKLRIFSQIHNCTHKNSRITSHCKLITSGSCCGPKQLLAGQGAGRLWHWTCCRQCWHWHWTFPGRKRSFCGALRGSGAARGGRQGRQAPPLAPSLCPRRVPRARPAGLAASGERVQIAQRKDKGEYKGSDSDS